MRGSFDSKSKNWVGEVQRMRGVGELKSFLLKMKGMVHQSCLRSAMLLMGVRHGV